MPTIEELQARQAQLAAAAERLHPKPPPTTFEDEHFRLPNYEVTGPGQATQADGKLSAGSYEAAGVIEPTEVAFMQSLHVSPAIAKQLLDTVKSLETCDPDPNLIAGYTGNATSLADAETRRVTHVLEAKRAVDSIGGVYVNTLAKSLDKLPRAALDLLIRTVAIKKRALDEERPR
jgi:hypothetical protein